MKRRKRLKSFEELTTSMKSKALEIAKSKGDGRLLSKLSDREITSSDNLPGDKYEIEYAGTPINVFMSASSGIVTLATKINNKFTELEISNIGGTYIFSDKTDFMFSNMQGVGILSKLNIRALLKSLSKYYRNSIESNGTFIMYVNDEGLTCISDLSNVKIDLNETEIVISIGDSEMIYNIENRTFETFDISLYDKRNKRALLKEISKLNIDSALFDNLEADILTNKRLK